MEEDGFETIVPQLPEKETAMTQDTDTAALVEACVLTAHKRYAMADENLHVILRDLANEVAALQRPPAQDDVEPVAWRYRYISPQGPTNWAVRQSEVCSSPAKEGLVEVQAEPLYTHSAPHHAETVDLLREAADEIKAEYEDGCRNCLADCSSANPPPIFCPPAYQRKLIARIDGHLTKLREAG